MVLSARGRKVHKYLVNKASKYFSDRGYTVLKEAKLSGKHRIDILAIKGSEKIGIECQLTISYKIIKQKYRDYGLNLTKMIFFVPLYRKDKMDYVVKKLLEEEKLSKNFFDIWTENVDISTSLRISKKTKELLTSMGGKGDTYDDVVIKLAEHYKKCNKVKNNGASR